MKFGLHYSVDLGIIQMYTELVQLKYGKLATKYPCGYTDIVTVYIVCQVMNLTAGDHISVKEPRDLLPFHHAIVVEEARDPTDKVKVIYHSGSGAGARVELADVELRGQVELHASTR